MSGIISTLAQATGKIDPALMDAIILINAELERISQTVFPPPRVPRKTGSVGGVVPLPVTGFTYSITRTNVILSWDPPIDGALVFYEIRQGSVWDSAERLFVTSNLLAVLNPLLEGTTTFLIRSLSTSGSYSLTSASLDITITPISSIVITPGVINNFVTLNWSTPISTFNIDYYVIYREGIPLTDRVRSNFYVLQETEAGSYTYGIRGVDIAGNQSPLTSVTLDVSSPTDFEFEDSITSDLSGTAVNGVIENDVLYVSIDSSESWEDHFLNNSWDSPQDQVDAGYPLYIQPTLTSTASYEEVFDFTAIFQNVIVSISYLIELFSGSFTIGWDIRISDDNVSYSSPFTTTSFFATSLRYVKVKAEFTGATDLSLLGFYNFVCSLFVRREVDGGEAEVFAADSGGTVIEFNKPFKFVESITVTPLETNVRTWVYDFAGGTNPTEFRVLLWNSSGTRIDGTISWIARGVL